MDYKNEDQMEINTDKQDTEENKDKTNNMTTHNDPTIKRGKQPTIRYHQLDSGPYSGSNSQRQKSNKPTSNGKVSENQ
jgi:hypothetical protein